MDLRLFYFLTLLGTICCQEVIKMRVKEDEDVILPCSLDSTNIRSEIFDWKKDDQKEVFLYGAGSHYNNGRGGQDPQFKGRVFHFKDQLQSGDASIEIRKTKVTDSGSYSCIFPHRQPRTRSIIELLVGRVLKDRTEENIQGAAPEPCVTRLHQTKDQALLQCEVRGAFPEPKVEWLDSSGTILESQEPHVSERGGHFYIILQTTVTKTDNFSCVATQEKLSHQISTVTYVHLYGAASQPSVKILEETNEGVLLQCEVRGVSPKPKVVWKDSAGNIVPAKEPEVTENEGSYNIILKATVTKTDNYRCEATQEDLYTETYVTVHEFPNGLLIAVTIFSVVFVLVLIILLAMKIRIIVQNYEAMKFPADDDDEAQTTQSTYAKELPSELFVAALVSGSLLVVLLLAVFANKTCTRVNCSTVSDSSTALIAVVAVLVSLFLVLFIAYRCWLSNCCNKDTRDISEKSVDPRTPPSDHPLEEIPLNDDITSHETINTEQDKG